MNENEEFAKHVQNALKPLHNILSGFSNIELLKIFGGLQLIPENASHQIRLEVDNLFVGVGSKEAIIGKLQRKSNWIASHLDVVLKWMGIIQQGRKWKCKPMVVIDREMISPRLRRSSVQIVSFNQLKSMFIPPKH